MPLITAVHRNLKNSNIPVLVIILLQNVPEVKVTTSGFNSRVDSESKTSYTHWLRSYKFLKYSE